MVQIKLFVSEKVEKRNEKEKMHDPSIFSFS